ncbi:MAG: hypothetical protein K2Z81_16620, partial [Cyanobacteria bacterium]|nr:hypothetical protein [Cyanobacteriota bacterium]
ELLDAHHQLPSIFHDLVSVPDLPPPFCDERLPAFKALLPQLVARLSTSPLLLESSLSSSSLSSTSEQSYACVLSPKASSSPKTNYYCFEDGSRLEKLDHYSSFLPSFIQPGPSWQKTSQASLLSKPVVSTVTEADKKQGLSLLQAVTRGGELPLSGAHMHVLLVATHCYDQSLLGMVLHGRANPMDLIDRSSILMATTIKQKSVRSLLRPEQSERVQNHSPDMFF